MTIYFYHHHCLSQQIITVTTVNSCMVITLLNGYALANLKTLHVIAFDSLVSEVLTSFLGSTDVSNYFYQYQNQHDFS